MRLQRRFICHHLMASVFEYLDGVAKRDQVDILTVTPDRQLPEEARFRREVLRAVQELQLLRVTPHHHACVEEEHCKREVLFAGFCLKHCTSKIR